MTDTKCCIFLMTEVPDRWKTQPNDDQLQAMAKQLHCTPAQLETVTLLSCPETNEARLYNQWLATLSPAESTGAVGIAIHDKQAWLQQHGGKPTLLAQWTASFNKHGRPPPMFERGCYDIRNSKNTEKQQTDAVAGQPTSGHDRCGRE